MNVFHTDDTAKLIGLLQEPLEAGARLEVSLIGRAGALRDFSGWLAGTVANGTGTLTYKLHTPSQLYDYDGAIKYLQADISEEAECLSVKAEGVTLLLRGTPSMFRHMARACATIADMLEMNARDGMAGTFSPYRYVFTRGSAWRVKLTPGSDLLTVQGVWDEVHAMA